MNDLLHQAVLGFNAFVIVYMAAMQLNQLLLLVLGWRDISDYVKRPAARLRDDRALRAERADLDHRAGLQRGGRDRRVACGRCCGCDYPRLEVVVVNDGSSDGTLEALMDAFALVPRTARAAGHACRPSRCAASTAPRRRPSCIVIDKENGGKADALNAGHPLRALPALLRRRLRHADRRRRAGAAGAAVPGRPGDRGAAAASCASSTARRVEDGHVTEVRTPRNLLVNIQIVEYLRAFLVGPHGLVAR